MMLTLMIDILTLLGPKEFYSKVKMVHCIWVTGYNLKYIFILQIMTSLEMPLSAALNTTRSGQIRPGNSVRATGFGV